MRSVRTVTFPPSIGIPDESRSLSRARRTQVDPFVFTAVLAAAACHAGWNALLKLNVAPVVATVLVAVAAGLLVLPLLPFTPLPAAAAWPYIVASAIIHVAYFVTLAEAYRWGDLSQVYPIARGTAPLLTAALAALWLQRGAGRPGWAGMIVLGGWHPAVDVQGRPHACALRRRAVAFALATSLTITAYTLVDGIGARLAGARLAYTVWLFIGDGITMAIYGWLRVGPAPHRRFSRALAHRHGRRRAFDGGLRHRHLGHDSGADRAGGGAARDQRAVRRPVRAL